MPKILPIINNPNPILRKKSVEVKKTEAKDKAFTRLISDMVKTMMDKDGAGLAAPQIGHNIRVAVVNHDQQLYILINPTITKKSWAKEVDEEGCLSVLNEKGEILYGPVSRHKKIICHYTDDKGQKKKIAAEKLLARIIQHELDHLDGVLFIDRLTAGAELKTMEEETAPNKVNPQKK
ncbi:MAG: peptide deformylase [Candidatus Falkowbacteria bacterium]